MLYSLQLKGVFLYVFIVPEGVCPVIVPALESYLTPTLPATVTVQDPALQVLTLLRSIQALNRYWSCLYEVRTHLSFFRLQ